MPKTSDRRYALRMPPDWEPPVSAFMSEFDASKSQVSMALLGCQFKPGARDAALDIVRGFHQLMSAPGKADHVDLAECRQDSVGLGQIVATGYWFDSTALSSMMGNAEFSGVWSRHTTSGLPYGIFLEIFNIPMERYETLHSGQDHIVGVATVRDGVTAAVREHAYWGSMRDRMKASVGDRFEPEGELHVLEQSAHRRVVRANQNLAVIRSGQDLSATTGKELDEYLRDVEPNLVAGMNFLRDEGGSVHCYDCRFMRFLDEDGRGKDHTYGLAYFRSLEDLEAWAEGHPTHLAIFNAFMAFAPGYGPGLCMRLWHEVSVLPAANQYAAYINCAPGTGLLSAV